MKIWENCTKDHCTAQKLQSVGKAGFIGTYFFEDHNGNDVTMNSECYIEMINDFFVPELWWIIRRVWFQQDGVTVRTARPSMDLLCPLFSNRFISRFADTPWSFRSPDLSTYGYFLWRNLKPCVYEPRYTGQFERSYSCRGLPNWQSNAGNSGEQLPRMPLDMHQWKWTPHEVYCFPHLILSNANSTHWLWTAA